MPSYTINTITSWEDVATIRPYWESVQWHPGADFEFYHLVLTNRPEVIHPCIFVVSLQGKNVALLAARVERGTLPLRFGYATVAQFRVSRLVIMEGGFMGQRDDDIFSELLSYIDSFTSKRSIDIALLENMQSTSPHVSRAMNTYGHWRVSPAHKPAEHWRLQLPKTFEEFMSGRSKKRRYWLNRLPRVLDKDFPARWSIVRYSSVEEAPKFIEDAEAIAKTTYHRAIGVGFRNNEETSRRITMEARRQQLHGYVLVIDGEPQAFWYCFKYGPTLYLAATGYNPIYRPYEIGTILLLKVIESFCGTDITTIDFGLGDAEYKQRFGTEHFQECSLLVFKKGLKGRGLHTLHWIATAFGDFAKRLLDKLNATQRIKTFWRRAKIKDVDPSNIETPKSEAMDQRQP